ncbi:MAG TPA: hypothetical protein VNO26_03765 [Candidatus Limnocylindria bacterium]|nr:hypothetical protein [Candidatus Limnocylindria bacterium]
MTAADAALALLGTPDGPVVVAEPGAWWTARLRVAGLRPADLADARAAAGLVSFLGARTPAPLRRRTLEAVRERLAAGAPLVLVDHNRPRQWWRRPLAALLLVARGLPPSRARHPAARELDGAGFRVERLRLAEGERVQVVLARREG